MGASPTGWFIDDVTVYECDVADTTPPQVKSTTPSNGAIGADVTAKFTEGMKASTLNGTTFTLNRNDASTNVEAVVSYDGVTKPATLNPDSNLDAGATYIAKVATGAKDKAGNKLDQDLSIAGNQPKKWKFKVAP